MVRCPKCHEEINQLEAFTHAITENEVLLVDGKLHMDPDGAHEWTDTTEYCCPRCDECVADNENDALDILNGEES